MAYSPQNVGVNDELTPSLWNSTQAGIAGIKEQSLQTFTPTTNETWGDFLARIYSPLLSGFSFARTIRTAVQRNSSESISNLYFHCVRRLSSSTVWCCEYFHAASNGNPDTLYQFFISVTNSSAAMRRITITSNGFTGENISDQPASELTLLGLNNNE